MSVCSYDQLSEVRNSGDWIKSPPVPPHCSSPWAHSKRIRYRNWHRHFFQFFKRKTQIPSIAADVASLESCSENPRRYLTVTYCPSLDQTRPNPTEWFQPFVLFSFAFSNYTKPSSVGTYHFFCCYVLWTHRLHREIMLLVKGRNKAVMITEFTGTQCCPTLPSTGQFKRLI